MPSLSEGLSDLPIAVAVYLTVMNLAAFSLMREDKKRSKERGARRIPEKHLFFTALLGGSAGAILGMWIVRHKTKHWYFVFGMPAIFAVQLAIVIWMLL